MSAHHGNHVISGVNAYGIYSPLYRNCTAHWCCHGNHLYHHAYTWRSTAASQPSTCGEERTPSILVHHGKEDWVTLALLSIHTLDSISAMCNPSLGRSTLEVFVSHSADRSKHYKVVFTDAHKCLSLSHYTWQRVSVALKQEEFAILEEALFRGLPALHYCRLGQLRYRLNGLTIENLCACVCLHCLHVQGGKEEGHAPYSLKNFPSIPLSFVTSLSFAQKHTRDH